MKESTRTFLYDLLSPSHNAILIVDSKSFEILFQNQASERLLGFSNKELVGKSVHYILPSYTITNQQEIIYKVRMQDSTFANFEFKIKQIVNPDTLENDLIIFYYQSIPEQKEIDQKLLILNALEIPIFSLDRNLQITFVNDMALQTLGGKGGELANSDILDLLLPYEDTRTSLLKNSFNKQIQFTNAEGNVLKLIFHSSIVKDKSGDFNGLLILLFDLTVLKNSEEKIRISEERLRNIFATMNNGIVTVNEKGIVQDIAPIFKFLLFQVVPLEIGDFIFSFLDVAKQKHFLQTINEVQSSMLITNKEFEFSILKTDYIFEVKFIPIRRRLTEEANVILVFSDRTEAKRLDRQLIESMKFAGIGEIATGLAHEINNPLQSALLYLEDLILVGEEDPKERTNILKKIESANLRIRDLVRALLDLGRIESPTRDLVSPYYILVRAGELLEFSCKKKGISFQKHASPNLPGIIVRWQEIEQVLINCVVNSINALTEMSISREKPVIEIGIDLVRQGTKDWVVFSIDDNGPGMRDEVVEKAFLPLYTTRRDKQGTGLGLSISKKIINDHDGDIYIKSKLGMGTKIEIFLPVAADQNE